MAVVVKMAQNVLIGLVAFLLAIWFAFKGQAAGGEKPSLMEIWTRFPKFVLGFIVASLVFSFFMTEAQAKSVTGITAGLRGWWFTLAFLCIGLETKFKELIADGRRETGRGVSRCPGRQHHLDAHSGLPDLRWRPLPGADILSGINV